MSPFIFFLVISYHGQTQVFAGDNDVAYGFATRDVCLHVAQEAAKDKIIPEGSKVACLKAKKLDDGTAEFIEEFPKEHVYHDLKDET